MSQQRTALVLGAGGFIGSHMVKRLVQDGYRITGIDLVLPSFSKTKAHCFKIGDLRDPIFVDSLFIETFDEIYQFAADMGGCQFVFTGENDADIMHNSAKINLNILDTLHRIKFTGKIFYSSSACMYPQQLQNEATERGLKESDAYPGNPDSEYGWEKLFSERLYLAYARNHKIDIRIGRYHNIYGPEGSYKGGREKAPASICRKIAEAKVISWDYGVYEKESVKMWGDGLQRRSFLYIDDCIDATKLLMQSKWQSPLNIGSDESVTIKELWEAAIKASGFIIELQTTTRPEGVLGVMGRNSDNTAIEFALGWKRKYNLQEGIEKTYNWINERIENNK